VRRLRRRIKGTISGAFPTDRYPCDRHSSGTTMTWISSWSAIISRNSSIAHLWSYEIAVSCGRTFVLQLQAAQFEADLRLLYAREQT